MPKRSQTGSIQLVPGLVLAVPLGEGRFGAVRILQTYVEHGVTSSLVAITPWVGNRVPELQEVSLRNILRRHRGSFNGRLAAIWYDGVPTSEFLKVGVLPVTTEEANLDVQGAYGGHWSRAIVQDLFFEGLVSGDASTLREPIGGPRKADSLSGKIPEGEFWDLMALLDWNASDPAATLEPLIARLADLSVKKIAGFQSQLCEKLFRLDRAEFAREIGGFAFGSDEGFSPDHFLDVRAAVVARGREYYESVLTDPTRMPKDDEFELLLTAAEKAYQRKTGRTPEFHPLLDVQTYSNTDGWNGVGDEE